MHKRSVEQANKKAGMMTEDDRSELLEYMKAKGF